MARFDFSPTPLSGLLLVQRQSLKDSRGFFSRFFCADEFMRSGFDNPVAQINHTFTRRRGTVRGMHYQLPPSTEIKLVSCLRGRIFDVAIDLRKGSATFLKWHAEILSATNQRSLLIPQGFAHGFQTLTNDCEVFYLHSMAYQPDVERAVNACDPRLSITWPLGITAMSVRDQEHPLLDSCFQGVAP